MADHVPLCLSIPPKFSVANTVGFLKGKSAIRIHREFLGRERNFTGFHFWARGYCVSTVGLDEQVIREYICKQHVRTVRALAGLRRRPSTHGATVPCDHARPARRGSAPLGPACIDDWAVEELPAAHRPLKTAGP